MYIQGVNIVIMLDIVPSLSFLFFLNFVYVDIFLQLEDHLLLRTANFFFSFQFMYENRACEQKLIYLY
jgi:hypothetical protein